MPHDESKAKRGPDGKFLPGHTPPKSPGRRPGPNGVKARAAHLASERLEALLGKAADVIDSALDEGDSHVATWLIDRIRPPKNADFVRIEIPSELNTPQEAVEAAREAIRAACRGEISMSEARSYVALLERLGGMQGFLELERLKASLEELKASQDRPALQLPEISRVVWGHGAVDRETG